MAKTTGTARRNPSIKPASRRMVRAQVLAAERISPTFVRITVGGEDVDSIAPMGFDHWFRMFLPAPGRQEPTLPRATDDRWWPEYQELPEERRPVLRNYTIRRVRPAGAGLFGTTSEIEIDFASHGDLGPASAWAERAKPGDEIGILDEGISTLPLDEARSWLLVGDESAVPAVAGILGSILAADPLAAVEVFVEVPHPDDLTAQDLPTGENVQVHPVIRTDAQAVPGSLVADAVREAAPSPDSTHAFVAGESSLATGVRRHLVRECGWDRSAVTFIGYWKYGEPVY
ncbi:siderophore-interacting protein [Rhodococcus gordoniae]|uniref:siderophore-interacting protein n=1 Tax=Rhodococcus gordoniae TaxID=223392 RepID=UPI0020CCB4B0|nr:siderophore-interacting protein [Rhodococcus gordoniae]UTT47726.1 siderophore-interacting protein [Rhodococcus gordoniae]